MHFIIHMYFIAILTKSVPISIVNVIKSELHAATLLFISVTENRDTVLELAQTV